MPVNDYLLLNTWHKHKTRKTFLRCKMPRWNFLQHNTQQKYTLARTNMLYCKSCSRQKQKMSWLVNVWNAKSLWKPHIKISSLISFKSYWRPHYRENLYHSTNLMHASRDKFQNLVLKQHEHILLQYLMQHKEFLFMVNLIFE